MAQQGPTSQNPERQAVPGGEAHFALQVRLKEGVPNVPKAFELICTSQDESWTFTAFYLLDGCREEIALLVCSVFAGPAITKF